MNPGTTCACGHPASEHPALGGCTRKRRTWDDNGVSTYVQCPCVMFRTRPRS